MSDIERDDQDIERLLTAAGQRRNPPEEVRARVYASALDAWQSLPEAPQQVPVRSGWSGRHVLALAASTLLVLAAGLVWFGARDEAPASVGDVVFAQGSYFVNSASNEAQQAPITPDSTVHTAAHSLVTLRMGGGTLITLDEQTHVSISAEDALFLRSGRIYVDASAIGQKLVVRTSHSKIVDVGTQFEVAVERQGEGLTVAVREGRVDVSVAGHNFSAQAADGFGEVVQMEGTRVRERLSVATTDERWNWRRAGRKPYMLAGSTVYDYLQWMARDTGYELQFAAGAVMQMARTGILQGAGSSDDTDISEALATTRFVLHEPSPGRWVVDFRQAP